MNHRTEPARRILLLIPTKSYRAEDFLRAARRMAVEVVVASEEPSSVAKLAPAAFLTLDFQDPQGAVGAVREFLSRLPVSAVVAVDDQGTVVAAEIAQALGLPHNPVRAVRNCRSKVRMREALRASPVRQPAFAAFPLDDDPERISAAISYPCVLKPVHLAASRGVARADDAAEFRHAWHRLHALLSRGEIGFEDDTERTILVEDYVPGWEVAVEAILVRGRLQLLAVFDKPEPLEGPFFAESIYTTPSRLPAALLNQVTRTTGEAARSLGLVEGPIHAELRGNPAGVWLIEIAARAIGGLCSRVLRFGAGVSEEDLILQHALGELREAPSREARAAGVLMLAVPRRGTYLATQGLEIARKLPGIEEITMTLHAGQEVEPLPEGALYAGFAFARASTPLEVEHALRAARAALEIVVGAMPERSD